MFSTLTGSTTSGTGRYHRDTRDEVHAWLAFAEKRNDEALSLMRQVSDAQDKIGKSEVDIPAREMLADMLLELNKPEEALGKFQESLAIKREIGDQAGNGKQGARSWEEWDKLKF